VYLLDTNIWLERLLGQSQSKVVGELLNKLPANQMMMSDFTLHSLGVILNRYHQQAIFKLLVQDVLIDGDVRLASLSATLMPRVVDILDKFQLDFDDAYQYVIAERENAIIVSFDKDFDATPKGRQTPSQVLAAL
jgi:uncharacterized protein